MANQTSAPPILEDNKNDLIRTTSAMSAVSLVFLVSRIVCKVRYKKVLSVDDALLGVAWACLVSSNVLTCLATKYGLGVHIWDIVDFAALPQANELLFIGEALVIWGIAFAKTSFCFTLLRLAVKRWHKIVIWFCIITINVVMWMCALTFFVSCTPIAKKWDPSVPGTCWDTEPSVNFAVFAGVYSAMTDIGLAMFPTVLIWKLQMKRVEKVGVCLCMGMGVVSGVMACVKSAYLVDSLADYTYKSVPLLNWSAIELSVVVMACSIPFLRLLFREIRAKTWTGSSGSRSGYRANGYKLDAVNTFHSSKASSKSLARVQSRPAAKATDDSSDRSILGTLQEQTSIRRTDEIIIERSRRDSDIGFDCGYHV